MTFEPIDWDDEPQATDEAAPATASRPSIRRRFRQALTSRRNRVPAAALDAAYRERAHLLALLAAWQPAHIGHTDPAASDWAVLTVELPTGQACWHIAPADMDLFAHVQPKPRHARGWDGHSTEEKYARVRQLVAELHPEAGLDELKRGATP